MMDKKEYWIKLTMEDYGFILKAYGLAVIFLATQYPKPIRGKDCEWKKEKRKKNEELCKKLNKSQDLKQLISQYSNGKEVK